MSTVYFFSLSQFFVSLFSTSKIHSCEIRSTSAYIAIIHSLPSFCLIWWWYLHPNNIWCELNLNQCGVIPLVRVVMRFCFVNFNFGTVANFLHQILMFFVMCNLWIHHGNYILLQFSRMASIVFTCSNFWIGQNTTAVPLKRIDTLISLSSMNHLKCLYAFGTNEVLWLEKTFICTISLSFLPYGCGGIRIRLRNPNKDITMHYSGNLQDIVRRELLKRYLVQSNNEEDLIMQTNGKQIIASHMQKHSHVHFLK